MGYDFFGTPGQWLFALIVVAVLGYGALRGCEAGCSYAVRHVKVEVK